MEFSSNQAEMSFNPLVLSTYPCVLNNVSFDYQVLLEDSDIHIFVMTQTLER